MDNLNRRGFLTGLAATLAFPAICRAESLMVLRTSQADLRDLRPWTLEHQAEEIARGLWARGHRAKSSIVALPGKDTLYLSSLRKKQSNEFWFGLPAREAWSPELRQAFVIGEADDAKDLVRHAVEMYDQRLKQEGSPKIASLAKEGMPPFKSDPVAYLHSEATYEGITVVGKIDHATGTDHLITSFFINY